MWQKNDFRCNTTSVVSRSWILLINNNKQDKTGQQTHHRRIDLRILKMKTTPAVRNVGIEFQNLWFVNYDVISDIKLKYVQREGIDVWMEKTLEAHKNNDFEYLSKFEKRRDKKY